MQYRSFTKDNLQVSSLGFGCMRLPLLKNSKPDEKEAIRIIRHGIDQGINYIDTAVPYHDGESETIVGKALKNGYRDKVLVATKMPTWQPTKKEELDTIFEEQIQKLQVDCIDAYLLHCLQKGFWQNALKLDMISWLEKKREQGKIRYIGFSFHDGFPFFQELVDYYNWDFCQIQYNYVNETVQAGTAGLKYAAQKGLSVIIMEPLFGGVLASPPGKMNEYWKKTGQNPIDLALRWIWDKPEVALVLSGMSNMEQTVQNIEIASRSGIGTFTQEEHALISNAQAIYNESTPIKCTKCRYCVPCPSGVEIPLNFETYNNAIVMPDTHQLAKNLYGMLLPEQQAGHCTECGACEEKCPQQLPIQNLLKQVAKHLK